MVNKDITGLVDKLNMLNVRFQNSTWAGITLPFF